MANGKQSTTKRMKMSERAQKQMEIHFPEVPPSLQWHRKKNDGYTSLPRTLPLVMQAIDAQSKGQPAGHTLFCLWSRSPDHTLIVIENTSTFASEAGFVGERAVDTWRKRMKKLRELCFIETKSGPSGEFHYVLLINPNAALERMRANGLIQDGLYARFVDRVTEIGAYGEIEAAQEFFKSVPVANSVTTYVVPPPPASI